MQTKEGDSQTVLRMLKNVAPKHCDLCGHKYEENEFNLIKQQGNHVVVHLRCHKCGNTYMLNVFNPGQGLIGSTRAQLNLDLDEAGEMVDFADSTPISTNEALDAYNLFTKGSALDNLLKLSTKPLEAPLQKQD